MKHQSIKKDLRRILLVLGAVFFMVGGAAVFLSLQMANALKLKSNLAIEAYLSLESLELSAHELGLLVGESYASGNLDEAKIALESFQKLSSRYSESLDRFSKMDLGRTANTDIIVSLSNGESSTVKAEEALKKIKEVAPLLLESAGNVLKLRVDHLELGVALRDARKNLSKSYRSLKTLERDAPKDLWTSFNRSVITVLSNDTAKDLAFVGRSVWRDVEEKLPAQLKGASRSEYDAISVEYKKAWEIAVTYYSSGEDFIVFKSNLNDLKDHLVGLRLKTHEVLDSGQDEVLRSAERLTLSMILIPIASLFFVVILFVRLTKGIIFKLGLVTQTVDSSMITIHDTNLVVAKLSKTLSESSIRQSEAVTETMSAAVQINAMAHRNKESADSAMISVKLSQDQVGLGMQSMENLEKSSQQIIQSMGELNLLFEDTVKQFENVISIIQSIQVKSTVINDIVFQTKLLSFNASVEAARAGEHGRGFSVVAEEVGNLARMSGTANNEISGLLRSSIDDVRRIATFTRQMLRDTIVKCNDSVEVGSGYTRNAVQVMEEIMRTAEDFKKAVESISNASKEQATGLDEISNSISMVHDLTLANSDSAASATAISDSLDKGVNVCQESIVSVFQYLNLVVAEKSKTRKGSAHLVMLDSIEDSMEVDGNTNELKAS